MNSLRVWSVVYLTFVMSAFMGRSVFAQSEIVLRTSTVAPVQIRGDWTRVADSTAAGGVMLSNPDRSRARIAPALASPQNYFEMRFSAVRGTAYHVWIRMRAANNLVSNDSVHVQFSDSVNSANQPIIRIGSTSSAEVVLQNGSSGAAPTGWGWADNGWGSLGPPIYFANDGSHVIRIQQREDGAAIDQIVLSAATYATTPPGPVRDDTRILTPAGGLGPSVSGSTAVIRPASAAAGRMYGTWQTIADATAAGGRALRNPNAGAGRIAPALSNPASYFEASFTAAAGGPYHVWVRMRADSDSLSNDSVHLQFNDSTTASGSATARIGTTSSLETVLQAGPNGAAPDRWGWTDNGWGSLGSHVYFATSGTHTIRVQQREDGAIIDQIVISRDTFLTTSPGWRRNDQTIFSQSTTAPTGNGAPTVTLTAPVSGTTFNAPATVTMTASASDPENRLARVEFFNGSTRLATDTSAPFSYSWSGVAAGSYQLRAVAYDADGASATSSTATITVGASTSPLTRRVAFTASANHATVTRYVMDVYVSTATIGVTLPLATSDLGKPTPNSANEIIVDRTSFLGALAPGTYRITVSAVGTGGSSRSAAITFTR